MAITRELQQSQRAATSLINIAYEQGSRGPLQINNNDSLVLLSEMVVEY